MKKGPPKWWAVSSSQLGSPPSLPVQARQISRIQLLQDLAICGGYGELMNCKRKPRGSPKRSFPAASPASQLRRWASGFARKRVKEKHYYHRDNNHNKYFKQFPAGAASATFHDSSAKLIKMSNYRRLVCLSFSKEVKLPTICTDEKQRWEESEKRREETRREEKRRSRKRKSQKKEDPGARKGRIVVAKHCVFSSDLWLRRVGK